MSKSSKAMFVVILDLIILVSIFNAKKIEKVSAQTQSNVLFEENFDSNLDKWDKIISTLPSTINLNSDNIYRSTNSAHIDYQNDLVSFHKNITSNSNVLARVYIYDYMTNQATAYLGTEDGIGNKTAIGIRPKNYLSSYFIRFNDTWHDSGVARSKGWHMFEVITTPTGTYVKIDNEFSPLINSLQTSINFFHLSSNWNGFGQATFDEVKVVTTDTRPWHQLAISVLDTFYRDYGDTDFSPIYNNNSSNTLRSLLNTADAFHTYSLVHQDPRADQKAVELYTAAVNNNGWDLIDDWQAGLYLKILAVTTHNLRAVLPSTVITVAEQKIAQLSQTFITAKSLRIEIKDNDFAIATLHSNKLQNPDNYRQTRISMFDDLSNTKRVFFGAWNQDESQSIIIGVDTNEYPNTYFYRVKGEPIQDSGIERRRGWVNFLIYSHLGVTGANIEGENVGANYNQSSIEIAKIASPWSVQNSVSISHFDNFNIEDNTFSIRNTFNENIGQWLMESTKPDAFSLVHDPNYLSFPKSRYIGDTKAEDNAWGASGLSTAVNYVPEIQNSMILSDRANCFAYHTITTSTDNTSCGYTTQNVYDDYRLDNHFMENPNYSFAVLSLLTQGALSFTNSNQTIPTQFHHNYSNLYAKAQTYVDPETLTFPDLVSNPDWYQAADTFYRSLLVTAYLESAGQSPGNFISTQTLLEKQSLMFHDLTGHWVPFSPISITDPKAHGSDPHSEGYLWLLNSHYAGSILAATINNYVLPSITNTPPPIPSNSPTPTSSQTGDVDGDLDVDYHDYFTLIGHFLSTTFSAGDFKFDNIIDIFDFNVLVQYFGSESLGAD